MLSAVKPFCAFRSSYINFHVWDKKRQCNAYMKNGKPAIRCPEHKTKKLNLENVIDRISKMDIKKNNFNDEDIQKPAFLRRNTRKVRYYKPNFNERKNKFIERLNTELKAVHKQYFHIISKYYFHLETFHGYDTFVLPTFTIKKKNDEVMDNFNDVESRISQVDKWLEDSMQYESGYIDEIVQTRTRRIYRSNAMTDLRDIDKSSNDNGPQITEITDDEENIGNGLNIINTTYPGVIENKKRKIDDTPDISNIQKKKKMILSEINTPIRRSSRLT